MTPSEKYVHDIFQKQFGFRVDKIPEANQKRPDFYMEKEGDEYLIEVKLLEPALDLLKRRDDVLESGVVYDEAHALIRTSGVTKRVSNAKSQLAAFNPSTTSFRVLCFVAIGHNSEARVEQIETSLYGRTTVADWSDGESNAMRCYYFGYSDFHKYRSYLDGALVIDAEKGKAKLCINDLAPRYEEFRCSILSQILDDAVIDPPKLDHAGEIWLVKGSVDRSKKDCVIDYLRRKYSLSNRVMDMYMRHVSATISLREKE